ncbi:MAG: hypothetical protein KA120_06605 [Candidatus Goldbacteria bacterium]|nr:hypothetical protein [Candidatus Goldiibacteriota bacterium]
MIFFYNFILSILIIAFSPLILTGIIINKKWREDIQERFCIYKNMPSFGNKKTIWFHAASVGEVQALTPVLKELKNICGDFDFVVTTTSINGKNKIKKDLSDVVSFYSLIPVDLYFFTDFFIKRINPRMAIFIETEFWPNLINNLYARKVPMLLINGRISEKSYAFYKTFSFLFGSMLNKFLLIIVQSEKMFKRFVSIGKISGHKMIILPNTKYSVDQNVKSKYNITINRNKKIIVAGSIREGEEELVINAFYGLKDRSVLIIAPRRLKRVKTITKILKSRNLKYELWTNLNDCNKITDYEVVVLNTMGELMHFYSIGDVAIVGGGFKKYGGHNPMEPAGLGLPVIMGMNVYNFEDTSEKLTKEGGSIKVESDPDKLYAVLKDVVENEDLRKSMGEKNRKVIENFRPSADTTALLIKEMILDKKLYEEKL